MDLCDTLKDDSGHNRSHRTFQRRHSVPGTAAILSHPRMPSDWEFAGTLR
jgi:hypothetical protein